MFVILAKAILTFIRLLTMNRNFFLLLFCWSLLSVSVYGQYKENQSNKFSLKEIQEEAAKSIERWNYYLRNDLDSLKLDAQRIYLIGIEGQNEFAINVGKRSLGSYLIRTGQAEKGIVYLKDANTYFEKKSNFILQTEILNEIGNGYLNFGKPVEAENYYLKSLRCGKKSPDETSAFLAEVNLAQAYINLGNLEKAAAILHHYKNEALKRLKLESVSTAYALLGTIESRKGNMALAKEYFKKSADFGFKSKSNAQIAHAYNNMAIVYFQEGNSVDALEFFTKALEMRLKTKNVRFISESYFNLGGFYHELGEFEKANEFYIKCEEFCIKHKLVKEQMDAVYSRMEIEKAQGKFEKALERMETYSDLQTNYYSELSKSKTADLEMIDIFDQLEEGERIKLQEAKLLSVIDDQTHHTQILYGAFAICSFALLFLAIYRKKIN